MANNLAMRIEDDFSNGAETVEIVFGIVFAVGLGAALVAFQQVIYGAFNTAKSTISTVFTSLESPHAPMNAS